VEIIVSVTELFRVEVETVVTVEVTVVPGEEIVVRYVAVVVIGM